MALLCTPHHTLSFKLEYLQLWKTLTLQNFLNIPETWKRISLSIQNKLPQEEKLLWPVLQICILNGSDDPKILGREGYVPTMWYNCSTWIVSLKGLQYKNIWERMCSFTPEVTVLGTRCLSIYTEFGQKDHRLGKKI